MLSNLGFLLLLLAVPAAEPSPEPPPLKPKPPTLKFNAKLSQGTSYLIFDVTNPNRQPIYFYGYGTDDKPTPDGSAISPFYQIKRLKAGEWKPDFLGWCGTGAGLRAIAGKATVTLRISVAGTEQAMAGLRWYPSTDRKGEGEVAWSDPATPTPVPPKP